MTVTMLDHFNHGPWHKTGQCVYCTCGERLYQGTVPVTDEGRRRIAEQLDALLELESARDKHT